MKINPINIIIFFFICEYIKTQVLSLTTEILGNKTIVYNNWRDLIGMEVRCPNRGIIKNFALKQNGNQIYFETQCYSSLKDTIDEGEPIIKSLSLTSNYYYLAKIQDSIKYLHQLNVHCWVDYALGGFKFFQTGDYLNRTNWCQGIKASSSTKIDQKTKIVAGSRYSLTPLLNTVVGSTQEETEIDIGFPLRSFRFMVDTSKSGYNPDVYFLYSYSKLKNMKKLKQDAQEKMAALRKKNTQKN